MIVPDMYSKRDELVELYKVQINPYALERVKKGLIAIFSGDKEGLERVCELAFGSLGSDDYKKPLESCGYRYGTFRSPSSQEGVPYSFVLVIVPPPTNKGIAIRRVSVDGFSVAFDFAAVEVSQNDVELSPGTDAWQGESNLEATLLKGHGPEITRLSADPADVENALNMMRRYCGSSMLTVQNIGAIKSMSLPEYLVPDTKVDSGSGNKNWRKSYTSSDKTPIIFNLEYSGYPLRSEATAFFRALLRNAPRRLFAANEASHIELVRELCPMLGSVGDNQVSNLATDESAPSFDLALMELATISGRNVLRVTGTFYQTDIHSRRKNSLYDDGISYAGIFFDGNPNGENCQIEQVYLECQSDSEFEVRLIQFNKILDSIIWNDEAPACQVMTAADHRVIDELNKELRIFVCKAGQRSSNDPNCEICSIEMPPGWIKGEHKQRRWGENWFQSYNCPDDSETQLHLVFWNENVLSIAATEKFRTCLNGKNQLIYSESKIQKVTAKDLQTFLGSEPNKRVSGKKEDTPRQIDVHRAEIIRISGRNLLSIRGKAQKASQTKEFLSILIEAKPNDGECRGEPKDLVCLVHEIRLEAPTIEKFERALPLFEQALGTTRLITQGASVQFVGAIKSSELPLGFVRVKDNESPLCPQCYSVNPLDRLAPQIYLDHELLHETETAIFRATLATAPRVILAAHDSTAPSAKDEEFVNFVHNQIAKQGPHGGEFELDKMEIVTVSDRNLLKVFGRFQATEMTPQTFLARVFFDGTPLRTCSEMENFSLECYSKAEFQLCCLQFEEAIDTITWTVPLSERQSKLVEEYADGLKPIEKEQFRELLRAMHMGDTELLKKINRHGFVTNAFAQSLKSCGFRVGIFRSHGPGGSYNYVTDMVPPGSNRGIRIRESSFYTGMGEEKPPSILITAIDVSDGEMSSIKGPLNFDLAGIGPEVLNESTDSAQIKEVLADVRSFAPN